MPTQNELIEALHKIMCSATTTAADSRVTNNDYFKRRVLGFRAEIDFENLIHDIDGVKYLDGGQFLSKKLTGQVQDYNRFLYVTISESDPDVYAKVYALVAEWSEVTDLFYVKVFDNGWRMEMLDVREREGGALNPQSIPVPRCTFYRYDRGIGDFEECETQNFSVITEHFGVSARRPSVFPLRARNQFNYFTEYIPHVLRKIYANRYFLDVVLRSAQGRQVIDVDGFLMKGKKTVIVEVKEKSPIKSKRDLTDTSQWRYGWDSRRLLWYLYLQKKLNLPVIYNVRQIDNRDERTFVQWDSILLDEFLSGTSWSNSRSGGGGEDTLIAPYLFFRRPSEVINSLQD